MRVAYFGSASFSVESLLVCSAEHQVVGVVTAPSRPGSRGRPAPRPVQEEAERLGLTIFAPERLSVPGAVDEVLSWRPDVLVVAAYGGLLPSGLLDRVGLGGINVHASLLPRWRGASPISAAILSGDSVTGVTIMQMEKGLDTGGIVKQVSVSIAPDATTPALTSKLATLGARALMEVLQEAVPGHPLPVRLQDGKLATYAPRLVRSDGDVDWGQVSASELDRKIRGLNPWPGVQAVLAGAKVKLIAGRVQEQLGQLPGGEGASPGSVLGIDDDALLVACTSGVFRLERLLPPGRKEMSAAAFLRGQRHYP